MNENDNGIGNGNGNGNGHHNTDDSKVASIMRTGTNEDYRPSSRSSFCSFCCWLFTFQHFCYVINLVNCVVIGFLLYLALTEYPKIEALQAEVEEEDAEVESLREEVQEKQQGQIQSLNDEIEKDAQYNFLSSAGFITLLTCLISMFHMSTHIQKFNQPKIQSKIIAILWMSPIYSVTSFLTLTFPDVHGWMAIIKDFYESYCIYVFLSFLMNVLGEGSRDKAVEALAKHVAHLSRPTRCLGCLYEPHPDTSDLAKANAVMTQCQVYCLQFTLVRPITTIISVFVLHRKPKEDVDSSEDDEFNDDINDSDNNGSDIQSNGDINDQYTNIDLQTDESSPAATTNSSNVGSSSNGGGRTLQDEKIIRQRLQQEQVGGEVEKTTRVENDPLIERILDDSKGFVTTEFPSIVPDLGEGGDYQFPSFSQDDESSPIIAMEGIPSTFSPSITMNDVNPLLPTFDPTVGFIPGPEMTPAPSLDLDSMPGVGSMFDVNNTTFSPSLLPTAPPFLPAENNSTRFRDSAIVDSTKAYFRSPGFALAMVVNVSIFFAFSGLLKLYHAAYKELAWCRPFSKFLTIKAVVFLTFWQGLAIMIYLVLTADPDDDEDISLTAHKYQNLLICLEMLFVAISQWWVFPSMEWQPNYEPREMHTPGLGIKDFVSDVGEIVKNRSGRIRKVRIARRKRRGGGASNNAGLYHSPGVLSSQYDGFGGPAGEIQADSFDDDEIEISSFDDSIIDDDGVIIEDRRSSPEANRHRLESDDTGNNADLEML